MNLEVHPARPLLLPSRLREGSGEGSHAPTPATSSSEHQFRPPSGAQASYLITLCEQARIDPPRDDLSKAEASKMIDELKAKLDL